MSDSLSRQEGSLLTGPLRYDSFHPSQITRVFAGARRWEEGPSVQPIIDFVNHKLDETLKGRELNLSSPPEVDLLYCRLDEGEVSGPSRAAVRSLVHGNRRNDVSRSLITEHSHIPIFAHPHIFPLYDPYTVDLLLSWSITSSNRIGHVLLSGLRLGAGHGILNDGLITIHEAQKKRSIFAESQAEQQEILGSVQTSVWNSEMNPLMVSVSGPQTIDHNFDLGPLEVPVQFTIQNYSCTHDSRYLLRYSSPDASIPTGFVAPTFIGQKTRRGVLGPLQKDQAVGKIWVTQPGSYFLNCWQVESDVLVPCPDSKPAGWTSRRASHRYIQVAPLANASFVTVIQSL